MKIRHGGFWKLELELVAWSSHPTASIYPEKIMVQKEDNQSIQRAKTGSKTKCPSTDECIRRYGTHNKMEYAATKNKIK